MDAIERIIQKQNEETRRDHSPEEAERIIADRERFRSELEPRDILWHNLTLVLHDCPEGESIVQRMEAHPWEHRDPQVVEVWSQITDPANEAALRCRYDIRGEMNCSLLVLQGR
jgi:hypothetical protein